MILNKQTRFLVLDVDGVITDPQTKLVNEKVLNKIISLSSSGIQIALNTGRSLIWLRDKIFQKITNEKIYFSCEKGAIWGTFENGKIEKNIDNSIQIPEILKDKVRELIGKNYNDCVFFDETKETMITAEMLDGFSLQEFLKNQDVLLEELDSIIQELNLGEQFRVVKTTVDVEIENIGVGKNLGARRILDLAERDNIMPSEFITIGDGESDIAMAEEFQKNIFSTKFVYVGNEVIKKKYGIPVIETRNKYTEGTLEFLKNL